jgi:hypothetical protein
VRFVYSPSAIFKLIKLGKTSIGADAVGAIATDAGPQDYFVYYYYGWMERGDDVPKDVTHVRIDLSVRTIKDMAFYGRRQLRIVILNDDLEEIGVAAFNKWL